MVHMNTRQSPTGLFLLQPSEECPGTTSNILNEMGGEGALAGEGAGSRSAFDSVSGFFHQTHIPNHAITLRESATTYIIHVEPI